MIRRRRGKGYAEAAAAQAGFTLTELLVVLAIIGLLIVAAPALIKTALPGSQSLAAAHTLADDLRMVRGLAIARGQIIRVTFDEEHQTYRAGSGAARTLPHGIRFSFASERAARTIDFRPDGGASGATVLVGEQTQRHRVGVDWLTGRVAIDE
ncbi:MAG: prepilin-type N-terminal cleavage/methylation domain-containing protein [Alphaproteobacteria bacterium]|nr:prepilin-type N-terminal cleavage/methylation domain-containing protein [Alphaproteobacteria bacterium]MBL7099092.1 prepilin-type N-terminal cleavage/methylation domain-containing protein [Alphaproteobacteria bacterium]